MIVPLPGQGPHSTSLGAVLTRLGHLCPAGCGGATEQLDARVWFTRRREPTPGRAGAALVVIDSSDHQGPLLERFRLLREVNGCTAADHIHVRERRAGDAGHALAAAQPALLTLVGPRRPLTPNSIVRPSGIGGASIGAPLMTTPGSVVISGTVAPP